mmetsp:Transcript_55593/g.121778  ORF Transcript_55593/g.121778 Transcript_55593/m.121778 type:complete len:345 (+) Transcript_55593:1-1035(+)
MGIRGVSVHVLGRAGTEGLAASFVQPMIDAVPLSVSERHAVSDSAALRRIEDFRALRSADQTASKFNFLRHLKTVVSCGKADYYCSPQSGSGDGCFQEAVVSTHVQVRPSFLAEDAIFGGICGGLDRLLLKHSADLDGVLCSYNDMKYRDSSCSAGGHPVATGGISADVPFVQVGVRFRAIVFRPFVGCLLTGIVSKCDSRMIGVTVLGYWSGAIYALGMEQYKHSGHANQWVCVKTVATIAVNAVVRFVVQKYECTESGDLRLRGVLGPVGTGHIGEVTDPETQHQDLTVAAVVENSIPVKREVQVNTAPEVLDRKEKKKKKKKARDASAVFTETSVKQAKAE